MGAKGGERMNKILLIIVALIVVFGAFTFLGDKKTNQSSYNPEPTSTQNSTSTNTNPQGEIITVVLANNAFTPKDIVVKAGTRVVWINKSGRTATVSSDAHPTHRLYPLLNLGEFANGSSVQIVFDKPGKYSYHNHLSADQIGTVTVE